jgi:DNA-binding SARP family transcriptional activator
VRVCVLGPLTVSGGHSGSHGLRATALELLSYLAIHRSGASRDQLLEALWPDQDPQKTRSRLYQATRDARRLVGKDAIITTKGRYILDRALVAVDIDELEEILTAAERSPDEHARIAQLEKALALFRDEPLAGADYYWVGHSLAS